MKVVKISFTAWRDKSAPPRSPLFQEQLDAWTARVTLLSAEAARINEKQADSETGKNSLARIRTDLEKIDSERTLLLSIEKAAAAAETRAASEHEKAGTFGYQVFNEEGSMVQKVVDEDGYDLPANAVYSYVVVDYHPPLPAWAKKGKVARFE